MKICRVVYARRSDDCECTLSKYVRVILVLQACNCVCVSVIIINVCESMHPVANCQGLAFHSSILQEDCTSYTSYGTPEGIHCRNMSHNLFWSILEQNDVSRCVPSWLHSVSWWIQLGPATADCHAQGVKVLNAKVDTARQLGACIVHMLRTTKGCIAARPHDNQLITYSKDKYSHAFWCA